MASVEECVAALRDLASMLRSVDEETRQQYAVERTANNTTMTLAVAFNYGGRADVIQAVRQMVAANVPPDAITEQTLAEHLYTRGMPDPDLIIRTGGEFRLSNFLIWQAAYSEYYATPIFWPDFDIAELEKAINVFEQRERRFGGLPSEPVESK